MVHNLILVSFLALVVGSCSDAEVTSSTNKCESQLFSNYNAKVLQQCVQACINCNNGTTTTCSTSCTLKGAR
ncbi:hypothetical protein ABIB90_007065 [Bradyrhizobium sp. JR4.1]